MIDRRRLVLGSASTLLLSLAPWQIARGARMVDVRMWPAEEYTRVTLEYDSPLNFKYFFVRSSKPLRLVVDIKGLELTVALQKQIAAVKPDDPYIAAMRIGQFQPDTVRLVMDLKTDVKPEVFQLQPFANYKYRLVFDIYPAHPTDEISRLLNGLEEGSEAPDGDPLGSLLAGLDKGAAESPVKPPLEEPEPKEPVRPSRPSKPKKPSKSIKPKLIIVVDPGHGGEDPGAIGRGRNREKTVVLQIAKRLAALINDDPGMKAIMTRNTDHFVSLGGRVAIEEIELQLDGRHRPQGPERFHCGHGFHSLSSVFRQMLRDSNVTIVAPRMPSTAFSCSSTSCGMIDSTASTIIWLPAFSLRPTCMLAMLMPLEPRIVPTLPMMPGRSIWGPIISQPFGTKSTR